MKLSQLLGSLDVISSNADMDLEISSICYNSLAVQEGCLFVAVRGFKTDGHKYIKSAYEKGAAAAIVEEAPKDCAIPYILVNDSRKAIAVLASEWFGHPERRAKVIGVTGTNGKTTVTNLIKEILESNGHKCGLVGTNGNMIGSEMLHTERTTPESYDLFELFDRMTKEGCEYIIMEVSSHSLVLNRVYGIEFETAVFTNLTQDHLDFHVTMDEYAKAKAILFDRCRHSVVNSDDAYAKVMLSGACRDHKTFSARSSEADFFAYNILLQSEGVAFDLRFEGESYGIKLNIPGMFSVYNALAAIGCCMVLGLDMEDIAESLAMAHGVKGRAQVVPTDTDYTVLLDYAHTPDGVENILKAAKGFAKGRVVGLFGCGGDRDKTKRPIMGRIAGTISDFCIVTSDNPRSEEPMDIIRDILPGVEETGCPHVVIEDRREAIRYALSHGQAGDVIVLMGKGHENYQEIKGVKHHLDEYEEVLAYFKG
ncbi:MAG: UDP-N-acetylmuramoyl-L-alanyl-D-glutamate--2,6-diaminopimelate ligase [Clostridiaceae bacterium]|nr:UDP-N-acetylmuramoyl-L-alanyl-D-glutamate--2,6-diaminopimelate ligase [Clostridiaceae bacterium]